VHPPSLPRLFRHVSHGGGESHHLVVRESYHMAAENHTIWLLGSQRPARWPAQGHGDAEESRLERRRQ
jgi:hypothetical protein